jgi:uncharacterized membrane protein
MKPPKQKLQKQEVSMSDSAHASSMQSPHSEHHDHYTESGEHLVSHEIKLANIGRWLQKGWKDMADAPFASLAYGLLMASFTSLVLATMATESNPMWVFILATSVIMGSPFLATGLYHIARQVEEGKEPRFGESMFVWKDNISEFAFFGVILGSIVAIWSVIAPLIVAIIKSQGLHIVNPDAGFYSMMTSDFWIVFSIAAAVLGALVFCISVVTIPLLLKDKNIGVIEAMIISWQVSMENKGVMFAWGLIILVLLAAGVFTLGFFMILIMPLLGYASWHAFRDLVDIEGLDFGKKAQVKRSVKAK